MAFENFLNTTQAAKIARKHPRTIVAWIQKGKLKALKMPGGRGPYLIDKSDLEDVLVALYTPHPYQPGSTDAAEVS